MAGEDTNVSDFHYRSVRNKPLLMLHVIRVGGGSDQEKDIPAFSISFPASDYETSVEVVANQVYISSMLGAPDNPDDEEDFDAS